MSATKQKDRVVDVEEITMEGDTITTEILNDSGVNRIIEMSEEQLKAAGGQDTEVDEDQGEENEETHLAGNPTAHDRLD